MTKLLLVEDDTGLGYILKEYLELHDYQVELVRDGESGRQAFHNGSYDLCILDVMLPKMNGFVLAEEIRAVDQHIPIIFLTAKALKVDKLKGFKIGADDYMVKPVDEEELIARIEAISKRTRRSEQSHQESTSFTIGTYRFDYPNRLLWRREKKQRITGKEAEVLKMLCQNEGRILDRKRALTQIWGENNYFKRRSMDVFLSRLRKYLSEDPNIRIINVHGKGYILEVKKTEGPPQWEAPA